MNEILIAITGLISVGGSAFFGWLFGRRKTNAEAQTTEIDNEIRMSNYYKGEALVTKEPDAAIQSPQPRPV